jgi:hypothetical protein
VIPEIVLNTAGVMVTMVLPPVSAVISRAVLPGCCAGDGTVQGFLLFPQSEKGGGRLRPLSRKRLHGWRHHQWSPDRSGCPFTGEAFSKYFPAAGPVHPPPMKVTKRAANGTPAAPENSTLFMTPSRKKGGLP